MYISKTSVYSISSARERAADPERDLLPRLLGQAGRFLPALDLVSGR